MIPPLLTLIEQNWKLRAREHVDTVLQRIFGGKVKGLRVDLEWIPFSNGKYRRYSNNYSRHINFEQYISFGMDKKMIWIVTVDSNNSSTFLL